MTDDHDIVCQGIETLLRQAYPESILVTARNAEEALHQLKHSRWDLMLLDISMPGRSGLDLLVTIREQWPQLPVLMLSAHSEKQYAVRVLRMGAAGYLTKDHAREELLSAVRTILAGGKYVPPCIAQLLVQEASGTASPALHACLSDREFQVMRRLAAGQKASEIARDLCVSPQSVGTYRTRIFEKLQLNSVAELIAYCNRHGLDLETA